MPAYIGYLVQNSFLKTKRWQINDKKSGSRYHTRMVLMIIPTKKLGDRFVSMGHHIHSLEELPLESHFFDFFHTNGVVAV